MADDRSLGKMRDCPVTATIDVIGGKWKPRILWRLRSGSARFGELRRVVGVSEKVLTQNLKALERAGVISRASAKAGGVTVVEYAFTDYGFTLAPVLDAIGNWGARHQAIRASPTSIERI